MGNELIHAVEALTETATSTQKIAVFINSEVRHERFDLVSFCESRGIDMSNMIKLSRLFQIGEKTLVEFWNYCLQNQPEIMESLKDPQTLYRLAVTYQKMDSSSSEGGMDR